MSGFYLEFFWMMMGAGLSWSAVRYPIPKAKETRTTRPSQNIILTRFSLIQAVKFDIGGVF